MKNIFIFLLIPFLISALDEALKSAIYYMSKNGLQFLSTTGRFGQNLNDEFAWMVEDFLGPPSIASSVKAINNLRKEIISRLDEIEENIKLSKKDILNEIRGSNYVNGFGKSLDSLLVQINDLVDGFFVEVYINGNYQGLYTMNIPKAEWMFDMDKNNPNHNNTFLLCNIRIIIARCS